MFVVAANDARPEQMVVSSIRDPDGNLLAEAKANRDEMIVADLDLSASRKWFADSIRENRPLHVWRKKTYRDLLLGP